MYQVWSKKPGSKLRRIGTYKSGTWALKALWRVVDHSLNELRRPRMNRVSLLKAWYYEGEHPALVGGCCYDTLAYARLRCGTMFSNSSNGSKHFIRK
jgi:hypothetical protein